MPRFRSFAKINLMLEVLGRRADGYHELATVFQTIDLADEVEIEVRPEGGVTCESDAAALPIDDRNLAVRAARALLATRGGTGPGLALRLTKRIPLGGGLGGGSANAATVLLAGTRLLGMEPSAVNLVELARSLGADVPFFLQGGTAVGLRLGDEIVPLPDPPGPPQELWLALPAAGIATADVFAELRAEELSSTPSAKLRTLLASGATPLLADLMERNALEAPAFRLRPELAALYTALARSGARRVRMSGSGSTLVALFDDPLAARSAGEGLPAGTVWKKVSTLDRAAWRAASGLDAREGGA
jgi:4-diphosphocytidyl-2-C-methyl-D-erythritol kinase